MSKLYQCPACGRDEGHFLNCRRAPRPIANPLAYITDDSVCGEEGCDDPVKSLTAKYCLEHSTKSAHNARAYRKRLDEKEKTNG